MLELSARLATRVRGLPFDEQTRTASEKAQALREALFFDSAVDQDVKDEAAKEILERIPSLTLLEAAHTMHSAAADGLAEHLAMSFEALQVSDSEDVQSSSKSMKAIFRATYDKLAAKAVALKDYNPATNIARFDDILSSYLQTYKLDSRITSRDEAAESARDTAMNKIIFSTVFLSLRPNN